MSPRLITVTAILGAALVLSISLFREPLFRAVRADHDRDEKYLFVWAGDQERVNPDFLAVANFDERSDRYGSVIATVPLPNPGARGNEPHHVGLSADGRVLAAGGLLSVLKGQKEERHATREAAAPPLFY